MQRWLVSRLFELLAQAFQLDYQRLGLLQIQRFPARTFAQDFKLFFLAINLRLAPPRVELDNFWVKQVGALIGQDPGDRSRALSGFRSERRGDGSLDLSQFSLADARVTQPLPRPQHQIA